MQHKPMDAMTLPRGSPAGKTHSVQAGATDQNANGDCRENEQDQGSQLSHWINLCVRCTNARVHPPKPRDSR